MTDYHVTCDCGAVGMSLTGEPRVRGHCHCQACRTLLNTPYHSVNAWMPEQVRITSGEADLIDFQHPYLKMRKIYCGKCGEVMFNTNAMDWRVVSQHLMAKNNDGILPDELKSLSHFHYGGRVIDVVDDLPKKE
ncbi:glutathione-dependent formaldehyde-activating enzyme [Shimia isoporae]|uniref:Glutathione-dependent formaldehyde-activating enzyme n=1 Tax=Shimia isoporae TaxID=647720 RepID=A0A4R1NLF4_9RHOB|nr:GFA family protein [Shimia isoporae]TCL08945.1 glutathione-dependent formaldehyde-activating enzyme [Shimia isoporae]